ncbi:cyclohexanecarboxyl-CoA dehydrogenase [compost metagenome]
MAYHAPLKEMLFAINELADLGSISQLPGYEEATSDTAQAVLEEAARFNEQVVAPLNRIGDAEPSSWKDGLVTTTPGFKDAFRQFGEGGWQGVLHPQEFGGQGLPKLIAAACIETLHSANLSFALCPMLTDGAIEALLTAGTDEQKATFLPKLISGEWTGTMNLTEPQAGEENRGLEYMFIMMNSARFSVGIQGIAVSERAYQQAVAYARERVQSRPVDGSAREAVTIIHHPDVKRMLMTMRALTEGARAVAYVAAAASDAAHQHPDEAVRQQSQALYEFLVPVIKGWSTELSIDVTSLGVQVHGGMGFIEETGAAQHYRDARILPIYEGTTAIQANDLVGRKTVRDGGAMARAICAQIAETEAALGKHGGAAFTAVQAQLANGRAALEAVVEFVVANAKSDPNAVFAGSVPYLKLCGIVFSGWQLGRAMLAADAKRAKDPNFHDAKIATAHFFAQHILSQASALHAAIVGGSTLMLALPEDLY